MAGWFQSRRPQTRRAAVAHLRFVPPLALIIGIGVLSARWTAAQQAASDSGTDSAAPTSLPALQSPLLNSSLQPAGAAPLMLYPTVETRPYPVVGAVMPATQISLVPEGTYLLARTGRFAQSADGRSLTFTFDYNGAPTQQPPLNVLPNRERFRVEQSLVSGRDQRFIVTGLVTEYRNVNGLLLQRTEPTWALSAPPSTDPGVITPPAIPPTPAPPPTTGHATSTAPAEQILTEMLAPTEVTPPATMVEVPLPKVAPVDASTGSGAVAPHAGTMPLLVEGTLRVDRVARLSRTSDGRDEQIVFDSDDRTLGDPPLIVLPNLKLVGMENMDSSSSRDLRFRVTGRITEYRGRNYILLEKAVVIADSAQSF